MVLGDNDGVVVVPPARGEEIPEKAGAYAEKVEKVKVRIRGSKELLDVLGVRATLTGRGLAEG